MKTELEYYKEVKELNNVGTCGLFRFMFTVGLVTGIDKYGYKGRYCYHTEKEASDALKEWDGNGDPSGNWIKYKGYDGEKSNPDYEE